MMRFHSSCGIALGPILMLLAFIAVIAAAITGGIGGFTANTATEGGKITASTIIRVGEDLQNAVRRVLSHGCAETQINFNNLVVSGYSTPNAPGDGSCDVFGPNGGAMTFPTVTASTVETAYDNNYFIFQANSGIQGLGALPSDVTKTGQDLAGFLPIDSQTLCQAINRELLLSNYNGQGAYTISTDGNGHFKGSYQNGMLVIRGGTWPFAPAPLMGCLAANLSNSYDGPKNAGYFFYVALLVR